jgi:hypothetical protein
MILVFNDQGDVFAQLIAWMSYKSIVRIKQNPKEKKLITLIFKVQSTA